MFGWGKKKKAADVKEPEAQKEAPKKEGGRSKEIVRENYSFRVGGKEGCHLTLALQVPFEKVEKEVGESFRRIQNKAKIPGFRPGKAPIDLVKKTFEGTAREDALDRILRRTVSDVMESEKISPVATPVIDKIDYALNQPLKFELKVECAPTIELKDYAGMSLEKPEVSINEEFAAKKIDEIREANARLVETNDAKVEKGHFVVVDYEGFLDGQPLADSKAEGQLIDTSAPQAIAGFTEGLLGGQAGETRDVTVTFPADHPKKELAGKSVVFKVNIAAIKTKQLPALDDEFAKDMGCENLQDLRDRVRQNLQREGERSQRQALEKQIAEQLLQKNVFDVPPSLVDERTEYLNNHLKQYLLRGGASEEDWKKNEPSMTAKNRVEAEKQVRLSYVIAKIWENEKFELSDSDIDGFVKKTVEGVSPDRRPEMKKWMEAHRDELRAQLKEERIYSHIINNAKLKTVATAPSVPSTP